MLLPATHARVVMAAAATAIDLYMGAFR